jgi:hypothetical protein
MMRLGAGKAQVKTDREAKMNPEPATASGPPTARFYERIGLFPLVHASISL